MTPVTSSRAITRDAVPASAHEPGLAIVIPLFNEATGLPGLHQRVGEVLRRLRAYAGFVGSGIAGLVANTATLLFAAKVLSLPVILAKLLAIGVSFLVNFSLARFVVFRPRPSPAE